MSCYLGRLFIVFFQVFITMSLSPSSIRASDLFELTVDIPGETASRSFSRIEDFIEQLSNDEFNNLFLTYQDNVTQADAVLNIRSIPAQANYAANSPVLNFQVPSVGINISFAGATRDESEDLFLEWFKGEGRDLLTKLLQEFVAKTPTDPVAGNPNSLMSGMVSSDFLLGGGYFNSSSSAQSGEESGEDDTNLIGIGVHYGHASSLGFKSDVVTLPLNYIWTLSKPGWAVIIDAPLTYINIEDSEAYHGSLGLGLRIPLLGRRWAITPMFRAGITGSRDIGSAAIIYSGSLTSNFNLYFGDIKLSLNNMVGYYRTDSIKIGDYDIEYDLENEVFRNGFSLEGSLNWTLLDDPTSWELAFVDTRFIGDDLFLDNYNEVALSFGTRRRTNRMTWQSLRLGAQYTFGDDYDGYQVTLNYRF